MLTPEQQRKALAVARAVAEFSVCRRLRVGAVLLDSEREGIATGYNICAGGCGPDKPCGPRSFHAENQAARKVYASNVAYGRDLCLVCTHSPCERCLRQMADHKVTHIYYGEEYRIAPNLELAAQLKIALVQIRGLYRVGPI